MNRVIIIVGGSSGIGLEASKLFVNSGDRVYNCSRESSPESKVHNELLDVVNPEQVKRAVDTIYAREGKIDVVVNSEGFSMAAPLEYVDSADYRYLFDVNLFGPLSVIQAVLPKMSESGGKIINISSIGGVVPIPYDLYYSASKAALNMASEALRLELKDKKVSVTAVMPGGTRTDFSYERKVYPADAVGGYQKSMQNAVNSLFNTEQKGANPKKVASTILYVANLPNPPAIVASGFINKFYYFLSRIAPKRLIHYIVEKKYGL